MANNHMQRCPTHSPRKYRLIPECDTVHTHLGNTNRYQSATVYILIIQVSVMEIFWPSQIVMRM